MNKGKKTTNPIDIPGVVGSAEYGKVVSAIAIVVSHNRQSASMASRVQQIIEAALANGKGKETGS